MKFPAALIAAGMAAFVSVAAAAEKATITKPCTLCHKAEDQVVRGPLSNLSRKMSTLELRVGSDVWLVRFDKKTPVTNAKDIKKLNPGEKLAVSYEERDGKLYAKSVRVKPVMVVPKEQLVDTEFMLKLIEKSPAEGNYVIVDARPGPRYHEGHIPRSVNLPLPAFEKLRGKVLPKDKDTLIVFYCEGIKCSLSPKSSKRAEGYGYTNIKIYHDGLPVWEKGGHPVYTTAKGLASYREKQIPLVLVDVRAADQVANGVIAEAVAIPADGIATRKADFPADKGAPIILYGSAEETAKAFPVVRGLGYQKTSILEGGIEAWLAAGQTLSDKPQAKIVYVPKPRPGAVDLAAFEQVAKSPDANPDILIVDVRGKDEASKGMIKGAINIPLNELEERLGELPQDKRIYTQCNTGPIAEMAYNALKEKGYDAAWLNAKITVKPDGSYVIQK